MRGENDLLHIICGHLRYTPACAGKTGATAAQFVGYRVHPRLRGENSRFPAINSSTVGTPPLARGKQVLFDAIPGVCRYTPACAGKTLPTGSIVNYSWVHPRLRGENQMQSLVDAREYRYTPACAGKTLPTGSIVNYSWVHPRLRGENVPNGRD